MKENGSKDDLHKSRGLIPFSICILDAELWFRTHRDRDSKFYIATKYDIQLCII